MAEGWLQIECLGFYVSCFQLAFNMLKVFFEKEFYDYMMGKLLSGELWEYLNNEIDGDFIFPASRDDYVSVKYRWPNILVKSCIKEVILK